MSSPWPFSHTGQILPPLSSLVSYSWPCILSINCHFQSPPGLILGVNVHHVEGQAHGLVKGPAAYWTDLEANHIAPSWSQIFWTLDHVGFSLGLLWRVLLSWHSEVSCSTSSLALARCFPIWNSSTYLLWSILWSVPLPLNTNSS